MSGGYGEESRGEEDKTQGERISLVGTIHFALTRDEANHLLFLFGSLLLAFNHATHGSPRVPSSLISLTQAVRLHSPGRAPDIRGGVKSNVLSGFLLKSWKLTPKYFMLNTQ